MDDAILSELVTAAESLRADQTWLNLFAENIHWSSCEGLLQCSLLGAVNRRPSALLTDREKRFSGDFGTVQPDLIVFDRADYWAWHEAEGDLPRRIGMVRGLVQLKMAWTRGNATRSAAITQKAKAVAEDAGKLARFSTAYPQCRAYLGVTVAGFHQRGEGEGKVGEASALIRQRLREAGHSIREVSLDMLADVALTYWASFGRGEDANVLSARLLLVRVG